MNAVRGIQIGKFVLPRSPRQVTGSRFKPQRGLMRPGVTRPRVETRHQSSDGQAPSRSRRDFRLMEKVQVKGPDEIFGTQTLS
jgi:hypothetical protein